MSVTYQIADVTKPLLSVYELNKAGKVVVFDGKDSFIKEKNTGRTEKFTYDGNGFVMEMWMKGVDSVEGQKELDFIGQEIVDL